jgi:hypothetical protein
MAGEVIDSTHVELADGTSIAFDSTGHGIDAECADLVTALAYTRIDRLAIYDPAVSINGAITADWVPELDLAGLLPTVHAEVIVVISLSSDGARYAPIDVDALLLNGERGPDHLRDVVDLPHIQRATVPRAGHDAPDLEAPQPVADQLRGCLSR